MNNLFTVLIFISLTSHQVAGQSDEQPEYTIVRVGESREIQTIQEALKVQDNYLHIILDSGLFLTENGIYIQGNHIILEGVEGTHVECYQFYDNVIWLNGDDITIRNLHLRHYKPGNINGQNCSGRVLGLDNCTKILIENCDLNGCGLAGIHDNGGNDDVIIRNNYIHYNSFAAITNIDGDYWMEETDSIPGFYFEGNRIENNGPDRKPEFEKGQYQTIFDLPDSEGDSLMLAIDTWEEIYLDELLMRYDVTPNCEDCHALALMLFVIVDQEGSVVDVLVDHDILFCGSKEQSESLRKEILELVKEHMVFSSLLWDKILKFRVGYTLKC